MVNQDNTNGTTCSSTNTATQEKEAAATSVCENSLALSSSCSTADDCCISPLQPQYYASSGCLEGEEGDYQQQQDTTNSTGLRHRYHPSQHQQEGKVIVTCDIHMTPALQFMRQRSGMSGVTTGNNNGATCNSSITTTPPESPSLHSSTNGGRVLETGDSFLLPRSQTAAAPQNNNTSSPCSSMASSKHKFFRRSWVRAVWVTQLVISTSVISVSIWSNQDSRKYVVIDPQKVDASCARVFLNVMATSPDDKDAIVCCDSFKNGGGRMRIPSSEQELVEQYGSLDELPLWMNRHVLDREDDIYYDLEGDNDDDVGFSGTGRKLRQQFLDICPMPRATKWRLPLVNRLAKFPDAWLLPLFPLLIRMLLRMYQSYLEPEPPTPSSLSSSSSSSKPLYIRYYNGDATFGIYTFRRLLLYFLLMMFRGCILFMALNVIEDQIAHHSAKSSCWYSSLLRESQSECYGRVFDFSDHIVLYFAQLLPIALLEFIHSMERPYWPFRCFRKRALPVLLTFAMLYLYTLVFLGVYKTASYFHTASEITAGFVVSLIGHLPLGWVQCSESPTGRALRYFFFGRINIKPNPPKLSPSVSSSSP